MRSRLIAEARSWVPALVIFALSRLYSTTILGVVFSVATANGWEFASYRADPHFFTFSGSWDASAYRTIAEQGYPVELPRNDAGEVIANPWAFLPVFAWVANGFALVTGLPFYTAGTIGAVVFGAVASVLLFKVVERMGGEQRATWATIFFAFGPLGFILQVAYAESLFLALTFAALLAMVSRRYEVFTVIAVVAAFTRPGELALSLALGFHLITRIRSEERVPTGHVVRILFAGAITAAAGLAWTQIAAVVTGEPEAYLLTELAFWRPLIGEVDFVPLTPWFLIANTYLGGWGIAIVVLIMLGAIWLLTRPGLRRLGADVVGFAAAYVLYVFAVFLPQQSLARILMPLAPVLGADAFTGSATRRRATAVGGAVLQIPAVIGLWYLSFP